MRAMIFTFDQVQHTRHDIQENLPLCEALKLAKARCQDRCEDERPVREDIEGKGVTFRNHTDYVEVVRFIEEKKDEQAKAA